LSWYITRLITNTLIGPMGKHIANPVNILLNNAIGYIIQIPLYLILIVHELRLVIQ
jgi:antibiotic biosynthesis monooxygenase (ABM) superfamily enzyme